MMRISRAPCPNPEALKSNYKHPQNKDALRQSSADKCMYCESKVSAVYFGDVEHILPRKHFPELTHVWSNLGYVCARCNNAKLDQWSDETPIVNPYEEDPGAHIAPLGFYVRQRNGSERGEYTIRVADLNRTELVARRIERLEALGNLVDKMARTKDASLRALILADLKREAAADREFHLCATACLESLLSAEAA